MMTNTRCTNKDSSPLGIHGKDSVCLDSDNHGRDRLKRNQGQVLLAKATLSSLARERETVVGPV